MNSEPIKIQLAIAVVVCCLAVSGADGTTIDPANTTSIETSTIAESRNSDESSLQQPRPSNGSGSDTDLRVDVHANGSAVWTIQYRLQLDDANETVAFTRLREDIASNAAQYRERFRRQITGTVASAERTTDREMTIENVSVRAARDGRTGVVTYSFVWHNFAATGNDRLRIGDALVGLSLDNRTRLTISWPDEYERTTVRPTPTEHRPNAVSWDGPTGFNDGEPAVVVTRSESTPSTNSSMTNGSGNGELSVSVPSLGRDVLLPNIIIGALLVLVGGLGGSWFVRRRQTDSPPTASDSATTDRTPHTESNIPPSDDGNDTSAPATEDNDTDDNNDDRPSLDLNLLSNEERVVAVLKRSGGRAKQQQIIDELGWTAAKTSSVVSQLREDGTIEGFRLGRENVLQLTEEHENDTDNTDT